MKRLVFLIVCGLYLFAPIPVSAATWYAQDGSGNMSTRHWDSASGGGGTDLVWANREAGDVFVANAQTAIAVDVDPGVSGVKVTLSTATNGGGFTLATASTLSVNADITAGTTPCLAISGSTAGTPVVTIIGNVTGGSSTSAIGITTTHTNGTVQITGNITGGSAGSTMGLHANSAGPVTVTGNVTAGTTSATAYGLDTASTGTAVITGDCKGSDTVTGGVGCYGASGLITVIGNIIHGKTGAGTNGRVYFTPAATNYVLYPANASYVMGTINANATEMPTNPGAANVKSGTNYGSFSGTMASGGGAWAN